MAPKRSNNPIEDPPPASSSEAEDEDEEATSSEEEEEEEDDDDDDEEPNTQTPQKPETAALATAVDESDESGSDSESKSDTPAPTVQPIGTKPMEETSNIGRPRSKQPLASPIKASSAKRPSMSEQEVKESKRPKKKAGEEGTDSAAVVVVEEVKNTGDDPKKQLFQRLFSEDDEIAMLKGMLDYSAKNGADPCADMNAFYDFVKKSIHIDVTKAQLMDKIRRLRKKFENNAGKGKKGEDRTFSKPHEQKAFELSKLIWGKEGISGKLESSSARSTGKAKGTSRASALMKKELPSSLETIVEHGQPLEVDKKSLGCLFGKRFGGAGLEEEIVKKGLDIVGEEKRAFLEEKWRKLQIAELELFLQRSELIKEHAELIMDFFKSEAK